MGHDATKSTRADEGGDAAIGSDGSDDLPRMALRHSPEALGWVRRQRGWKQSDLARASGLAVTTISGLENGSRNAGPVTLAKLTKALECPQVVLEARPINKVATSAVSALDLLTRLLAISDLAYLMRRHGFVRLGFIASGRHIGSLQVQERDFDELMNALRRHFPNRRDGNSTGRRPANGTSNR